MEIKTLKSELRKEDRMKSRRYRRGKTGYGAYSVGSRTYESRDCDAVPENLLRVANYEAAFGLL